jgi:hypothetical protein
MLVQELALFHGSTMSDTTQEAVNFAVKVLAKFLQKELVEILENGRRKTKSKKLWVPRDESD